MLRLKIGPLNSKQIPKVKSRFKARLVAQDFSQQKGTIMKHSPVANFSIIRFVSNHKHFCMAHTAFKHKMRIKSRKLGKELCIYESSALISNRRGESGQTQKVNRLKQSGRNWNTEINTFFINNSNSRIQKIMFIRLRISKRPLDNFSNLRR